MLDLIRSKLGDLVPDTWSTDMTTRGEHVALFREYEDGEHRASLTPEMQEMLRISGGVLDQFNANYCELVVGAMADRLIVTGIDGNGESENAWASELLARNRFDALQMDVHQAAIRDGSTYLLVEPSDTGYSTMAHEPAWDTETGLIPVYDRAQRNLVCAVKVWLEGADKRVNFYYPDRIEKYRTGSDTTVHNLIEIETIPWVTRSGEPLGVPVVPVVNRSRTKNPYGISELGKVIPLQDVLNRALYSMVTAGELTAFQIRYLIGAKLSSRKIHPGMFLEIGGDGVEAGWKVEVGTLPQGDIGKMIDLAAFAIDQICTVSRTPLLTGALGGQRSGEALKMLETGLLGKIRGFHVKAGNAWEDVLSMAARLQAEFGNVRPPVEARWSCKWLPAELRNDVEVIENAGKVADRVSEREYLRLISPVWGWDSVHIEQIREERAQERTSSLAALGGALPGFEQFATPG